MTGNSTPAEKLRAVFLAALMIGSVFAAGIAFSGTAAANVQGDVVVSSGNTVGDTVTVDINGGLDNGETVTIENVVNGEVKNSTSVTDGGPADLSGGADGDIQFLDRAGKSDPDKTQQFIRVTDADGNVETVSYTVGNYLVQPDQDSVTHGATETIEWSIYEYPGDLADSRTFEYELFFNDDASPPGDSSLADSDVNDGTFITTATFNQEDDTYERDYPADNDNGPAYQVFIGAQGDDPGPGSGVNIGTATIDTRLEATLESTTPSSLVYQNSADIIANFQNASGPVPNYVVELERPDGEVVQSKTTANNGDIGYTAVVNDAAMPGDTDSLWNLATNEGGVIQYLNIPVDSQEANLTFTPASDARVDFPSDFTVRLNDSVTDDPISTDDTYVNGYINITGPFDDSDPVTKTSTSGAVTTVDKDATDGVYDYIAVDTNDTGIVTFTATPTDDTQEATLKGAEPGGGTSDPSNGLEVLEAGSVGGGAMDVSTGDAGTTPETPDYVGTAISDLSVAEPVNIISLDIFDGRTATHTGPTDSPTDEQSIFSDPISEVEPLPLAESDAARIVNQFAPFRLGNDLNRGFDEMTTYRVTFSLVDLQNDIIRPGGTGSAAELENITFVGAGIDATAQMDTNLSSATAIYDNNGGETNLLSIEETSSGSYAAIVRPTRVDSVDEQFDIEVEVAGESIVSTGDQNQPDSINTSGLFVDRFQVDGQTVTEIDANQNYNLSAQVKNAETNPVFVNNGRVNVTQRQNTGASTVNTVQLNSTDARTQSVNNGNYGFENVQVGPRGLDTTGDGIGDELSKLVFTAYQYTDADGDNALERAEVNNATVETLPLKLNKNLEIEWDTQNTSKYSGGTDELTLTHGLEYQQLAFTLTNSDTGEPVNLTDGLFDQKVALDQLSVDTGSVSSTNPNLIYMVDGDGDVHEVEFSDAGDESRPGDGYYVIEDIQESTAGNDAVVSENPGTLNEDDSFAFDSSDTPNSTSSYQLVIETPDRTNATADDTGNISVEQPQYELNISGVAGEGVPFSQQDTDGDNSVFDNLDHDQADNLNTNTSDISKASAIENRTYRFNATVSDALGTPLNDSDFNQIVVDFNGEGLSETGSTEFVAGPDVNLLDVDEVDVQNENGFFQFDYEAGSPATGSDGVYKRNITLRAFDGDDDPNPFDAFDGSEGGYVDQPIAQNPVVEVYDENGGELPEPEESSAYQPPFILAKDPVTNNLRIEAFPVDADDFALPNGLRFGMTGPAGETNIETTTQDVSQFTNTQLATEGYNNTGQVGFLSITPTGTGDGIIQLRSGTANIGNPITLDTDGNQIVFDVQRSNRQLDLTLNPADPTAEDDVTITATDVSTGNTVEAVTIIAESPFGDSTTIVTDENGDATLNASFFTESGQYTITTRRAGYGPEETTFSVDAPDADNPVVGDQPATNLDSDPLLEDVNGDGVGDIFDAIELYNNRNSDAVQDNIDLFDFDGDGDVDLFDAIELYNELSA